MTDNTLMTAMTADTSPTQETVSGPELSVIVPVGERFVNPTDLIREYVIHLEATGKDFELIYVVEANRKGLVEKVTSLAEDDERIRTIVLAKSFGESIALSAGLEHARGDTIMTLPAYYQVRGEDFSRLIDALDECDMAVAARSREPDSGFESFRRKAFHWMVKTISGKEFNDLGCGARAFTREVAEEIPIYGDQHRFMPLLATRRGFRVDEVRVGQSDKDRYEKGYGLKTYFQRFLDLFTVVFLVRFTKKPLRFFGMIGGITFLAGAIVLLYVIVERLFFDVALADRPALMLSSLLVVLGLQLFALGLLGELIIFTHARSMKEYTVEKIVN